MKQKNELGIESKIKGYINISVSYLLKRNYFQKSEIEDIKQDLWLFYYEKLYPRRTSLPDDYVFSCIIGKAKHILRSRLKLIQAGLFFSASLNDMQEDGWEPVSTNISLEIEKDIFWKDFKKNLTLEEQELIDLVLAGYTVREIARLKHSSLHILERFVKKMKKHHLLGEKFFVKR